MSQQSPRVNDQQARDRALRHLAEVAGTADVSRVCWDPEHHLQGHVDVDGRHLVVIAARDGEHEPRVLSENEWDALRRNLARAA